MFLKVFWQKSEIEFPVEHRAEDHNKNINSVIIINFLLAFVSFGKDILLASYLGTSSLADAFVLSYFIVDTIGNNLIAASLGVAVMPVLAGLHTSENHQRFVKVTRYLVVYTFLISIGIALVMFMTRYGLLSLVGGGLSVSSQLLSVALLTLLIPTLILFPLFYIGISMNQVYNRFNIPALSQVLFNLVFLIGLFYLIKTHVPFYSGVYSLALFICLGVLVMTMLVWIPILKERWRCSARRLSISVIKTKSAYMLKPKLEKYSEELLEIWKNFLPYLLTSLFPQLVYMFERFLASHLEAGSISGLNYAFRLVQFPIWVFIAAVSAVLFPLMAKLFAKGDKQGFNEELKNSIYLSSIITIPFSIILFTLREPIITVLLQRGQFDAHSVSITSTIMAGYTFTIIWQGFSLIWVRASLIEGKVSYAFYAAALGALTSIGFDVVLVQLIGAAALGYGAAIGSVINFATLYILLSHHSRLHFSPWRGLSKIVLANLPLLIVVYCFNLLWQHLGVDGSILMRLGYCLLAVVICIPVYWGGLRVFRVIISD